MRIITTTCFVIALLTSSKASTEVLQSEPSPTTTQTTPTNAETSKLKPGDALSPFEKDGSVRSSFGPGVVLRLNAIVAESKATIDKFDKVIPAIRTAVGAAKGTPANGVARQKADKALAQLDQLHAAAKASKAKLGVEGQALVDSRKYYDGVIFSGMARFVERIEDELGDEHRELAAKLKAD